MFRSKKKTETPETPETPATPAQTIERIGREFRDAVAKLERWHDRHDSESGDTGATVVIMPHYLDAGERRMKSVTMTVISQQEDLELALRHFREVDAVITERRGSPEIDGRIVLHGDTGETLENTI